MSLWVRLLAGLFALTCATPVLALCTWEQPGPPGTNVLSVSIPPKITFRAAPVGDWIARIERNWASGYMSTQCQLGDVAKFTLKLSENLEPAGFPNVYKTGVEGVGIRIGFGRNSYGTPIVFGSYEKKVTLSEERVHMPDAIYIDFIRTGIGVGTGSVPVSFSARYEIPSNVVPVVDFRPQGSTSVELVNNIYFTTCRNATADPQIEMGQSVTIAQVRTGNVDTHDFSLDIRCDGMNPTTKPAVKVYFEGQWQTAGSLLKLDGAGRQDVAAGAGIKLSAVRDNGSEVSLPTTKANAFALTWYRSATDSEYYRFRGRAKYAPTGAEMREGKAAGTLSYILDYN